MKKAYYYVALAAIFLWLTTACTSHPDKQQGVENPSADQLSKQQEQGDHQVGQQHEAQALQGSQPESPDAVLYAEFAVFWSEYFAEQLRDKQWEGLNRVVHPRHGVFVISQLADLPIIKRFEQLTAVQNELPDFFLSAYAMEQTALIGQAANPEALFSQQLPSSYVVEKPDKDILGQRMEQVSEQTGVNYSDEELRMAKDLESCDLRQVILQDALSELLFARVQGKWYLVMWSQLVPGQIS